MSDVEFLKKYWGNRIIETDTAIYLVRLDTDRFEEESEKIMLEKTDILISTIGPKDTAAPAPAYMENLEYLFPHTYRLSKGLRKARIGFVWGPLFLKEKKAPPGKGELYVFFGTSVFLCAWGACDLRDMRKMGRRSFVKAILGVMATAKFALAALDIKHLIKKYSISKEEYIIMPEGLQCLVFGAVAAQTVEAFSLTEKERLGQKPVVYLALQKEQMVVLYFLQHGRDAKSMMRYYKAFLDEKLPQAKPENISKADYEKTAEFLRYWNLFLYVLRDNNKWDLSKDNAPLFK